MRKKNKSTEDQPESVQPVPSPGVPAFDRSSLRLTELFQASDIVFFREGPNGTLNPLPSHEAETRFAALAGEPQSEFKDSKTVTTFELEGGDKVTISGTDVIITPADGPAEITDPSLNLKPADSGV